MMFDSLQDVAVTLVAVAAAGVIVRRIFSIVQPQGGPSKCASCPSAEAHGQAPRTSDGAKPLTLVRSPDRQ